MIGVCGHSGFSEESRGLSRLPFTRRWSDNLLDWIGYLSIRGTAPQQSSRRHFVAFFACGLALCRALWNSIDHEAGRGEGLCSLWLISWPGSKARLAVENQEIVTHFRPYNHPLGRYVIQSTPGHRQCYGHSKDSSSPPLHSFSTSSRSVRWLRGHCIIPG